MSINFTKGRYVYMKKIVSAMLAVIIALSVMSISAFAENHDVEAIKKALFEVLWTKETSYESKKNGVENSPTASYTYNVALNKFLEEYNPDKLAKIDADNWRDIDKLYKACLDWDNDEIAETKLTDDGVCVMITTDGKTYTYVDNGDSWSLVDENGNEIRKLPKLTQFTYLNEDYQDDDSKTEENSSNKESKSDSSKTSERTRAAANAYKGKASGKSSKDSSELTDKSSEKQRATTSTTAPVEQESSNIGIYVVLIALIITVGVVIIVVNNNKNKKK